MGRTACIEPQCLYKGTLYLTSVPVQEYTLPYLSTCTRVHFTLPQCCTRVHFTLPQCLYKGALYLTSVLYKGALYLTSVPVQGCTLPYLSACTRMHLPLPYFTMHGSRKVKTMAYLTDIISEINYLRFS
jgi:hypothetical protein